VSEAEATPPPICVCVCVHACECVCVRVCVSVCVGLHFKSSKQPHTLTHTRSPSKIERTARGWGALRAMERLWERPSQAAARARDGAGPEGGKPWRRRARRHAGRAPHATKARASTAAFERAEPKRKSKVSVAGRPSPKRLARAPQF
jgi:hypothetical protein